MAHEDDLRDEADGATAETARTPEHRSFGQSLIAGIKEVVVVAAMALTLSFLVKTFLFQAFYIPSESMEDTLVLNDRVIASKLTPGPFELHRGDVVVFRDPGQWIQSSATTPTDRGPLVNGVRTGLTWIGLLPDTSEGHLIKRVVGLPGDHVRCCDAQGRVSVNGQTVDETYLKDGSLEAEKMEPFDISVPAGKVWVMGDNRGDSADSRPHDLDSGGEKGSVSEDLVVGKAVALVWPFDRARGLDAPDAVFASVPEPTASTGADRMTPSGTGPTSTTGAPPTPGGDSPTS